MTTAMVNQAQLFFRILSDTEERNLLDPDNSACPYHNYIGNRAAVDEFLDLAYQALQTRCQHYQDNNREMCPRRIPKRLALLGPASSGKTTCAKLFAQLLKLPYCETLPEQLSSPNALFEQLKTAYAQRGIEIVAENEECDVEYYILPACVLFIDEIHLLSSKMQDSLLKMTEASESVLLLDGVVVDCRHLTIIIATTDKGKLRPAFKTRFRHITLKRHTTAEIAKIVKLNQPKWTEEDCLTVAKLKPVPREAKDFADSVNLAAARKRLKIKDAIKTVAEREGICDGGVNATSIRALKLLRGAQDGLSRVSLCAALNIEQEEFENDCMPCLVANELHPAYIAINSRHMITEAGLKYLNGK